MEEVYKKLIELLKTPVFEERDGKWQPLSEGASDFDPELARPVKVDGKAFRVFDIDIGHLRGVFHDIRILIQRLEAGCEKALVELKGLVEDFLRFEKPELVLDWIDACEVLRSVLALYEWKGKEVSCDAFMVRADVQGLYRVFLNILDNAYRHSGGRIKVFVQSGKLVFEVEGQSIREGEGIKVVRNLMKGMGGEFLIETRDGSIMYSLHFPEVEE